MSKQASEFQYKAMSLSYRGKEIFKPLNTGWIDEHVACVREYVANIFFYRKDDTVLMIDAGYNYDRLAEKMSWLDLDPSMVSDILITHQDTDHVGAVERDSAGLFRNATLYIGRIENRYLTGERRRSVYWGSYKLPQVFIDNNKVLLDDGQVLQIGTIKVEALHVPGHTWGHMVYLVDDTYLFTGDSIWFGPDGGKSFLNTLAEDNELATLSLGRLEHNLRSRGLEPMIITGHTGWTDDFSFAFAHTDEVCHAFFRQKPHDPKAPYDAYHEEDDTEKSARAGLLPAVEPIASLDDPAFWNRYAKVYDLAMSAGDSGLQRAINYIASFVDKRDVVLDAACGTGAFSCGVAPRAGFVAACDYAHNMVAKAQHKARRLGLDNVAFGPGDICNLNFADESFDVTIAGNVLHLLTDPQQAVNEIIRVTKPDGIIIIPNYLNANSGSNRFLKVMESAGFNPVHDWDEVDFLENLEEAGLRVIEHRYYKAAQPLCVAICQAYNAVPRPTLDSVLTYSDVQETALVTLAIRASETMRPNPRIHDEKAKEIIDVLGVDVRKYDRFLAHEGVVARTIMFAQTLRELIHRFPDAVCINLGCGFDDKFSQVDNGQIEWFDVDLPDQIAVRRKVFQDRPRCTMLEGSAFDGSWTKALPKGRMNIIIMEEVFVYFTREETAACLHMLVENFSEAYLITEMMPMLLNRHPKQPDGATSDNASVGWGTEAGMEYVELEPYITLLSERSYSEEMSKYTLRGNLFSSTVGKKRNNRIAVFRW